MTLELLKKENDVVIGYKFVKTKFNKKENSIKVEFITVDESKDIQLFKCVANHQDFATLVQAVITHREKTSLNSAVESLKQEKMDNLGLLDDDKQEKLSRLEKQLELSKNVFSSLNIPSSYKEKHISEYPHQVLLLANYIDGIIPKFPVSKIKTLVTSIISELIETGKTDISDDKCKEVSALLKEYYAPIYNTNKDSIFKKWKLTFDLRSIRQIILSSGLTDCVKNGKFTYTTATEEKIRKKVAHALLRRMQKDNAEIDKKETKK